MKRRNYRAKRQAATFPLWPLLKGALLATAVILLLMGMWTLLLYGGIASLGTIPVANAVLKFLGAGLAAFYLQIKAAHALHSTEVWVEFCSGD